MAERLRERYRQQVRKQLQERFGYKNVNQIPRLEKVVVNMSVGEAIVNPKALDAAVSELDGDYRAEAGRREGKEVDRSLQTARRDEHRREGDAAGRPDVRLRR